jgi:hypothetical protein
MNMQIFESLLKQEPLLMEDISRNFTDRPSLQTCVNPSLFFGVGLCTSKQPAEAIPFDILAFFFLAEKLRRQLELDSIFVFIADEHAKTNSFMTNERIWTQTKIIKQTFTTIIHNLHLHHFKILLSSEIIQNPTFQSALTTIPPMENEYLHREIADLIWFTQTKNVRLKLGWSINNELTPQGHDERFFDEKIRKMHTLPLSFLFTKPGRTCDELRPNVSPYIAIANESRIVLSQKEHVQEKIATFQQHTNAETVRGAIAHMALIVRLFESLFIRIPKQTTEEKIQFIIDLCTHN